MCKKHSINIDFRTVRALAIRASVKLKENYQIFEYTINNTTCYNFEPIGEERENIVTYIYYNDF